ncbi:MAG: hypothetical protein IV100_07980 [Myxococcales bacterium]|nr:hypothetical protein [Myxococcales bacterium]
MRWKALIGLGVFAGLSAMTLSGCMITDEVKKLPKSGKNKKKGTKGGTDGSDPSAESQFKTTFSETAEEVDDPDGVCEDAPDLVAECSSESEVRYCEEETLFVDDCDAFADSLGYESGACFETEVSTDCFVCDSAEVGSRICCAADLSVCCDDNGDCFLSDDAISEEVATDGADATDAPTDGADATDAPADGADAADAGADGSDVPADGGQ